MSTEDLLLRAIASKAHGFSGSAHDFEPLLELTQSADGGTVTAASNWDPAERKRSSLSSARLADATTSLKPSLPECEATRHG